MTHPRKNAGWPFFILILVLEAAVLSYLMMARRMVIGHDGFELLAHQWFFINSAISHHEFPLWSPFLNHGNPVWWYFIYSRMSVFLNSLMIFTPWIKGGNFLGFFYGSLFFDKFILLCGVWLLARRYFSSLLTVFFVAVTVMATTITYTQDSFSLVMFYSIPLIIYLLHRFLDTFNWKWLFLTAFLFCVVSIHVYYFICIISLAIFVYFTTVASVTRGEIFKGFKFKAKDIVWMGGILLVLFVLGAVYVLGHDPSIYINTTLRSRDGGVPAEVFLSYGGDNNLLKWWELLVGISLRWDYTLYMGIICVPLIIIGAFFSKNTHKYPFLWGALFFFLFSCATPVSVLFYYIWPLMKTFRHIGYVAPLIKLYLCFLAGFGFEKLFVPEGNQKAKDLFRISMLSSGILLLNTVFLCQLVINPPLANFILTSLGPDIQHRVSLSSVSDYLYMLSLISLAGSGLFFFRPFIDFSKYASSYLIIFLIVHVASIYWYSYNEIQLRTFAMSDRQYHFLDFQKIPYVAHRMKDGEQMALNPREDMVASLQGVITNSVNNFTFSDVLSSKQRSDFNLKSSNQLVSTFEKNVQSPVYSKLTGVSQDKIQFFSKAYEVSESKELASILLDKQYAGDILFYQSTSQQSRVLKDDLKGMDLSQNQRLVMPYKVISFSPDQIIISVDSPKPGVWMQYSDNWYPSWKAEINGQPKELFVSSLAYKALPLQGGKNIIRFYLESKPVGWLYGFFMVTSLMLMILLFWFLVSFPA